MPSTPAASAPSVGLPPPGRALLLGVPRLMAGDRALPFGAERRFQLLAVLAVHAGQWVSRDRLAALLWQGHEPASARGNLRTVIHRTRELPGTEGLEVGDHALCWQLGCDVADFEAAAARGAHEEALSLYGGALLLGLEGTGNAAWGAWLDGERARLAALWHALACERLAMLQAPEAVAALARRILAVDPLVETAVSALAKAQSARGLNAPAAQTLAAFRHHLAEGADASPPAELQQLEHQLQLAPAYEPVRHQPDSAGLIGRRAELAAIRQGLHEPAARCLVLVGPGGIGKTATSRVAAAAFAERTRQRVAWVPLADLAQPAQLPARLASRLGLMLDGKSDGWAQVEAALRDDALLLVVDNAEHLNLCCVLGCLLEACPRLRLLVTSRVRLGVPGEQTLVMEGLPLPDDDERDPEILRLCDAVRLFEARALAVNPGFDLAAQAEQVVRLLHLVEGMPLAIELAAAWMRVIPAAAVVDELRQSIGWMDARSGVVGRALQASFEQSWRLLDDQQRTAFTRLALLPGPFGVEMAAAVAEAGLPVLGSLVDQSLLRADGAGRFSMHALIRQSAAERVVDPEAVLAAHAAFVARWLGSHGVAGTAVSAALLSRIDEELPHVRAAWAHALAPADAAAVRAMAPAWSAYLKERGLLAEGVEAFQRAAQAFAHAAAATDAPGYGALGQSLRALSALQYHLGDVQSAERSARRMLELAEAARDASLMMPALNMAASCLNLRSLYAEARPLFERARRLAEDSGADKSAAVYTANVASVDSALGDYEAARQGYLHALVLHRRAAHIQGAAITLCSVASMELALGRPEGALHDLNEALLLCRQHQLTHVLATVMLNLGTVHQELGDRSSAALWLERAWNESSRQASGLVQIGARLAQAHLDIAGGAFEAARAKVWEAFAIAGKAEVKSGQLECASAFGAIAAAEGRMAEGCRVMRWALEQPGWNRVDRDAAERRLARFVLRQDGEPCPDYRLPADTPLSQVLAGVS